MDKILVILFAIGAFAALLAVVSLIVAMPVYFLWNWLVPSIFGLVKISFMQAWGLLLLSGLLFKSSGVSASKSS